MHSAPSPNHPGKEWYEELCALAAIGELSSSEFDELQKHLAECGDCRQIYADFRRVSAGDLGLVAALRQSEGAPDEAGVFVDESGVLGRLLDRATRSEYIGPATVCLLHPSWNGNGHASGSPDSRLGFAGPPRRMARWV